MRRSDGVPISSDGRSAEGEKRASFQEDLVMMEIQMGWNGR